MRTTNTIDATYAPYLMPVLDTNYAATTFISTVLIDTLPNATILVKVNGSLSTATLLSVYLLAPIPRVHPYWLKGYRRVLHHRLATIIKMSACASSSRRRPRHNEEPNPRSVTNWTSLFIKMMQVADRMNTLAKDVYKFAISTPAALRERIEGVMPLMGLMSITAATNQYVRTQTSSLPSVTNTSKPTEAEYSKINQKRELCQHTHPDGRSATRAYSAGKSGKFLMCPLCDRRWKAVDGKWIKYDKEAIASKLQATRGDGCKAVPSQAAASSGPLPGSRRSSKEPTARSAPSGSASTRSDSQQADPTARAQAPSRTTTVFIAEPDDSTSSLPPQRSRKRSAVRRSPESLPGFRTTSEIFEMDWTQEIRAETPQVEPGAAAPAAAAATRPAETEQPQPAAAAEAPTSLVEVATDETTEPGYMMMTPTRRRVPESSSGPELQQL